MACKPESLARDRLVFEENGWELELLQTVDLFPQTGHIEVIARFVRPRPALTDVASSPVV